MKKLFDTTVSPSKIDLAVLIARVAIGGIMLTHGLPKLAMLFSGDPVQFPGVLGMSGEFSLALTVFAEVFCSLFVLIGFGTRLATIPLMITMLVVVLYVQAAEAFEKKELAIHFLLVYAVLFITGSGRYSVDHLLQQRSSGLNKLETGHA
jgi:putative oxidoreductase